MSSLIASCGGGEPNLDFFSDLDDDLKFYADTAVIVNPGSAEIRRGEQVTAVVTARYKGDIGRPPTLTAVDPLIPGVQIREVTPLFSNSTFDYRRCVGNEVPPGADPAPYVCYDWRLVVSADAPATAIGRITLSAQWGGKGGIIERLGFFDVNLTGVPATPDYQLAVVPPLGKVYATRAFMTVQVVRRGGFAEPVLLSLDSFVSGITGKFSPNPVPVGVDTAQLQLNLPASLASGTFTQLKVSGSGGGIDRSWQFGQKVEPLYTMTLATADGAAAAVLTPNRPLDIDVTIAFDPYGPFSVNGPGRIDLSLPDPPPGVRVEWLPDAQPRSDSPATLVLRRTLRLSGGEAMTGDLIVRATAAGLSPDDPGEATTPAQPFVEAKLPLRIDPALAWEYVSNGVVYNLNPNDAIGIGMQSDNRPVMAWLESYGPGRTIFLKRFDGATFAPSPPPMPMPGPPPYIDLGGLSINGSRIEQARMAMAGNDDVHVAFTYQVNGQEGARVGHGLHRRTGATWVVNDEVIFLAPAEHARSPRIAATVNDALALSYLVETGIPAGAGLLFVRSRLAAGALAPLPAPLADSINVSPSGQVLRDTPSIALRTDGKPWLAWIEERFAPAVPLPPALWLRGHDGTRWGAPIAVARQRPLVAAPTQLLVKPDGTLVVAWLEDSPARLMLATVDPLTGVPSELRDARNPDGALNITTDQPARDIALHLDPRGRVVVTWTEGPSTGPRLFAKRLSARGAWDLLGTELAVTHPTRSPFVTSDATGRLYVGWTGFFSLTDLDSIVPLTDVLVGRWNFTEDF